MRKRAPAAEPVVLGMLLIMVLSVHGYMAMRRQAGLLAHDEAISLLAAAGKSPKIDAYYANLDHLQVFRAAELQNLMFQTPEITMRDVARSLAHYDIHPPLYFFILHGLREFVPQSPSVWRMLGTMLFLVAAWVIHRWVWPDASPWAQALGLGWFLLAPAMIGVATELRQYPMVYLGFALSLAAMVCFLERRQPVRHTVLLMALAPTVLLWSQYGTAVWVLACFVVVAAVTAFDFSKRWKPLLLSTLIVAATATPLLLWYMHAVHMHPTFDRTPLADVTTQAIAPIADDLANAWWAIPVWWEHAIIKYVAVAVTMIAIAITAFASRGSVGRALWIATALWVIAWVVLMKVGIVPAHAVEPKYIAPLVVCPLVLCVRATSRDNAAWLRRFAMLGLVCLFAAILPAFWWIAAGKTAAATTSGLQSAQCLIINTPKRGYFLPLAAQMNKDAKVVLAPAAVTLANWDAVSRMLPADSLVLAEIDTGAPDARDAAAQTVYERLSAAYADVTTLREGPKRTVTIFRRLNQTPQSLDREQPDGQGTTDR